MSQTRVHELLVELFDSKDQSLINKLHSHEDFLSFQKKFSLSIPSQDLAQVFTHTSFTHEYNLPHQEQLEFLGDAVLQLIITEELYKRYPNDKEGHLSKLRSALVNEKSLCLMSEKLGLGDLLLVGKGEFKKKLFEQPAVLADTLEALLGQIFRVHGMEFTKKLFLSWLNEFIPTAFDENFLDQYDAKSKLQEKVLAKYKKLPHYTSEQIGEKFEITLWINDAPEGKGIFSSKKIGEKELAQNALKSGII